jgi:hypothetical protein
MEKLAWPDNESQRSLSNVYGIVGTGRAYGVMNSLVRNPAPNQAKQLTSVLYANQLRTLFGVLEKWKPWTEVVTH